MTTQTSRLGVLYDAAAAQQRVTSLFGGVGGYILHNRETLLIGGSILEMLRETSLLREGGYTLHNLEACGLSYNGACVTYSIGRCMRETGASRTATRDVTVRRGFTYCTTVKRYLFDRNECAPFIILL